MKNSEMHSARAKFAAKISAPLEGAIQKVEAGVASALSERKLAEIVALYQIEQAKKHKDIAEKDALTGVYRRQALENWVFSELATEAPAQTTIIFFDIDNFKRINDHFGHSAGDEALQNFSFSLQEWTAKNFGNKAKVGRWGGEEFVAVIPNESPDGVLGKFSAKKKGKNEEKIFNVNFESSNVVRNGSRQSFRLSASIGLSCLKGTPNNAVMKQEFERVVKEADSAMYYKKKNGKDGAAVYTKEMSVFMEQAKAREEENKRIIERAKIDAKEFSRRYPLSQGPRQFNGEVLARISEKISAAFAELNISRKHEEAAKNLYLDSFMIQLAV